MDGWMLHQDAIIPVCTRSAPGVPFFAEIKQPFRFSTSVQSRNYAHIPLCLNDNTQSNEHRLRTLRSAMDACIERLVYVYLKKRNRWSQFVWIAVSITTWPNYYQDIQSKTKK
ncbi:hypothetical protein SEVIR_2G234100v4 [Setaria viridis]|uniref:Uncharacterized protein n=2 Tax=Setaria TaxID=4554 RepID=A0A368Q240_SETIT|nr:hypothetical protein SETIT_2G224100v2 [Setaria italica]TKW33418.1 hypothetical protein SEVIR_2G234100v2 [Setaria viridis]